MRTTAVLLLTGIATILVATAAHGNPGRHFESKGENDITFHDERIIRSKRSAPVHGHWLTSRKKTENETTSEFPEDLFTPEQLRQGAACLHFIAAIYCFAMIGMVCSNYFLPSVDCICLDLKLSQDVAAATFMSFATTAPELFTVLIGTFITESDIGLGAVIGSGMFNILGVATFGGLAAVKPIQLEWWPLMRDSSIYVFCLCAFVFVIHDGVITLGNAVYLLSCYVLYFIIMLCNQRIRTLVKAMFIKLKKRKKPAVGDVNQQKVIPSIKISSELPPDIITEDKPTETRPSEATLKDELDVDILDDDSSYKAYFINYDRRSLSRKSIKSEKGSTGKGELEGKESVHGQGSHLEASENQPSKDSQTEVWKERKKSVSSVKSGKDFLEKEEEEEFQGVDLTHIPQGSVSEVLIWLFLWPGAFLLFITVPDCRVLKWRRYYPMTFLMCVFWIGAISYFGNWMISVIGETIGIPDSVMGMTFLAAGGSMPEAMSTVIMARQGEGGIGFSNSLGGNTMDVCLCLGLPWLLKNILSGPITIDSESLKYNSIALFLGIFILVGVSCYTKFNMNRKMGIICSMCYLVYIIVSVLLELGVIPS